MKENNKNLPLAINLNTYSHYSLLSSTLSIQQIIDFAIENKMQYVSLTDTNLYGVMEFYLKAKEHNLIPVIGLDIFYSNTNLVVYAKNTNGYKKLIELSSQIMTKHEFDLEDYLSDDFFCILKSGNFTSKKTKIYKPNEIAFNECRYYQQDGITAYNALNKVANNLTVDDYEELLKGNDLSLKSLKQSLNLFTDKQIETLNKEIQDINIDIVFEKNNILVFKNQENLSSSQYLKKLCLNGLNEKILLGLIESNQKQKYLDRIEYELKIIDNMGFSDYFLIVQDFIQEAKNRNILVGPGRGSSAGSLVAYVLGITSVDSIKYDLVFERFLNPGRVSMPDIDTDIMDSRRDEIINYLFEKYGYDHVAHIITFQRIKSKMAIRDIGRILKIDLKIINKITKLIPIDFDEDLEGAIKEIKELEKYYQDYTNLFEISKQIIGCPRQTGLHAAGIVLSKKKLYEVVPIQSGVNNEIVTQFSMEYLEDLGLIKMDLLGLTNLTTVNSILKLISFLHKVDIDLTKLNLEDQKVFEDASNGMTLGIFQLESPGMTSVVRQVKPKSIEDISLCSALFRPGPMQNIGSFVARRNGIEKISYIDPKTKDILESTYGIIVYQEQVISMVQKIANFTASEADIFRRIISKKQGSELEEFRIKFFEQAKKNNYSQEELEKIYNYIYTFANYGFNHSHSFAYSLISYWLLWLKHYYPTEFMVTLLTSFEGNASKTETYVNECKRLNIEILKPDINLSMKNFSLKGSKILFGFNSIKGIGEETSKKIIAIRDKQKNKKFKDFVDAIKFLTNNGVGQSTIETLIYAGAFDSFKQSKAYMLFNLPEIASASSALKDGQDFIFEPRLKDVKEDEKQNEFFYQKEIELIGVDFNKKDVAMNTSDIDVSKFSNYNLKTFFEIKPNDEYVNSLLLIKSIKIKKMKNGRDMAFIKAVDTNNDSQDLACFNADIFTNNNLEIDKKYIITIKTSNRGNQLVKIKEKV